MHTILKRRFLFVLLPIAIALTACPLVAPVGPVIPDSSDAATLDDCAAAAYRLWDLACKFDDGKPVVECVPTDSDQACRDRWAKSCRRAFADGRDWNSRCQRNITACSQREDAYRGRFCP